MSIIDLKSLTYTYTNTKHYTINGTKLTSKIRLGCNYLPVSNTLA